MTFEIDGPLGAGDRTTDSRTSIDHYPPLAYRGEDFRAVMRTEPCQCGLDVIQLTGEGVTDAVARHNRTVDHVLYRTETEGDRE